MLRAGVMRLPPHGTGDRDRPFLVAHGSRQASQRPERQLGPVVSLAVCVGAWRCDYAPYAGSVRLNKVGSKKMPDDNTFSVGIDVAKTTLRGLPSPQHRQNQRLHPRRRHALGNGDSGREGGGAGSQRMKPSSSCSARSIAWSKDVSRWATRATSFGKVAALEIRLAIPGGAGQPATVGSAWCCGRAG